MRFSRARRWYGFTSKKLPAEHVGRGLIHVRGFTVDLVLPVTPEGYARPPWQTATTAVCTRAPTRSGGPWLRTGGGGLTAGLPLVATFGFDFTRARSPNLFALPQATQNTPYWHFFHFQSRRSLQRIAQPA